MSYSQKDLRDKFMAWGQWRVDGGWSYVATEADNGLKIRAPGTHSDPTLSRVLGMDRAHDMENARVDIFICGLPKLTKSLVYSTYYYPLVERDAARGKALADKIVRDYGISTRIYYDQLRAALDGLGEWISVKAAA